MHRYAPASGTDSCFGEISLVSGAKPYGGNIIARTAGELMYYQARLGWSRSAGCRMHENTLVDGEVLITPGGQHLLMHSPHCEPTHDVVEC